MNPLQDIVRTGVCVCRVGRGLRSRECSAQNWFCVLLQLTKMQKHLVDQRKISMVLPLCSTTKHPFHHTRDAHPWCPSFQSKFLDGRLSSLENKTGAAHFPHPASGETTNCSLPGTEPGIIGGCGKPSVHLRRLGTWGLGISDCLVVCTA